MLDDTLISLFSDNIVGVLGLLLKIPLLLMPFFFSEVLGLIVKPETKSLFIILPWQLVFFSEVLGLIVKPETNNSL